MFGIILAEGYREFIYFKRYIFERLSSLIMLILIFTGFIYSSSVGLEGGNIVIDRAAVSQKLIGFTIWFFALDAVGHLSSALREDLHIGILEQIALTPYSLIYNMIGRSIARSIITLFNALVLLFIFNHIFHLKITIPFLTLPFFLMTYLGLYGLGLFFAGLTLIFKRLGPITTITRFLLLIFTGAIIPLSFFPQPLQKLSLFLPMTTGLSIIKSIILKGENIYRVFYSLDALYLIINTTSYLLVGIIVFRLLERRARKLGTLGTY